MFFWLIAPIIQAFLSIHVYTDAFVAVIYPGWEVVRNLCDILFIVALIAIAMGTLFRVESYQYKHLLVQLVIAALLINFSLVIGQAVLGLADTVQAQFLPANVTVIRSLAGTLMVGYRDIVYNGFDPQSLGTFAATVQPVFLFALSLGSFAVFCAIGAFLLIRVVALWVLLLISPIAYAAGVLPTTAHYREEWWQQFLKYAFFTPIMAFFLNMTAVMADTFKKNPVFQTMNPNLAASLGNSTLANFVFNVASNILLLVFLMAGLMVAEKAGVVGAKTVTGLAKEGITAPFKWTGKGAKTLGGVVMRGYSGFMANKAFAATEAEATAEQMKNKRASEIEETEKALPAKKAALATLLAKGVLNQDETKRADELKESIKEDENKMPRLHKEEAEYHKIAGKMAKKKRNFALAQFLNPKVVKKAWEERSHELEERAYTPSQGFARDMLNRYMPTEWGMWNKRGWSLGRKSEHGFTGKLAVIKAEEKHLEGIKVNRKWASQEAHNVFETGTWEELMTVVKLLSAQRNQDDFHNLFNEENGFVYSNYDDLMYMRKNVLNRFPAEAQNMLFQQLLEQEEEMGRTRDMFWDEDREMAVDDLSYMKDPGSFKEEKEKLLKKFQANNKGGVFDKVIQDMGRANSLADIENSKDLKNPSNLTLHRAVVENNINEIVVKKQRRGKGVKWLPSLEPASVRLQGPEGWTKYTHKGLLELASVQPTILQSWMGRIHEGEARALVYGGAMVDSVTKKTRIPTKDDGVYYEAWKQVCSVRPELAAAVWSYFQDPNEIRRNFDNVQTKARAMDPERGVV